MVMLVVVVVVISMLQLSGFSLTVWSDVGLILRPHCTTVPDGGTEYSSIPGLVAAVVKLYD